MIVKEIITNRDREGDNKELKQQRRQRQLKSHLEINILPRTFTVDRTRCKWPDTGVSFQAGRRAQRPAI